jgi:hypothetical protein
LLVLLACDVLDLLAPELEPQCHKTTLGS